MSPVALPLLAQTLADAPPGTGYLMMRNEMVAGLAGDAFGGWEGAERRCNTR